MNPHTGIRKSPFHVDTGGTESYLRSSQSEKHELLHNKEPQSRSISPTSNETKSPAPSLAYYYTGIKPHALLFAVFFLVVRAIRFRPIAQALEDTISFFFGEFDTSAYGLEPLSLWCWVTHLPLLMFGYELPKHLLKTENPSRVKSFGGVMVIAAVQGWFIALNHACIGAMSPKLEMQLFLIGQLLIRVQVLFAGIVVLFPRWGWLAFPIVSKLVFSGSLTMDMPMAHALSTVTLGATIWAPEFAPLFKLGYVATALVAPFVPDSSVDRGHAVSSLIISIPLGLMVYALQSDRRP